MKQQLSINEIRQLEHQARELRSEAIFDTFASPFKKFGLLTSTILSSVCKTNDQLGSSALGVGAR